MDYGTSTDPTPYLAMAYGIGFLLLAGYAVWNLLEMRKLNQMVSDLDHSGGGSDGK